MQVNYRFIKGIVDCRIACFLPSSVLWNLYSALSFVPFEAWFLVSLGPVQSPRKKQRAKMHIIWSNVRGSDCDCVVVLANHFNFLFMFSVLSELCQGWKVSFQSHYCGGNHAVLAAISPVGVWGWKALKHRWCFGAVVVGGDSGPWSSTPSERFACALAILTSLHRAVLASSSRPSTFWRLLNSALPIAGTQASCPCCHLI